MKKKTKEYNLLVYVDDSILKMKKFYSFEEMGKFVAKFQKKYPDHLASDSGYYIDYCITKIRGDIHFFTDGIDLK